MLVKNQIITIETILNNVLQFSRNAALDRGHDVTLNALNANHNWSSGMLLFQDNETHHYTGQEPILHQWTFNLTPQIQILWKGFQSDHYIQLSSTLRHATSNGHFEIYNQGKLVKIFKVNRFGVLRVKEPEND